jgi:hypothetical protein
LDNNAKIILHQAARMIWLSDRIEEEFAKGRPGLQIMFYLIAAELAAKLCFNFQEEGESRSYVRKFFLEICSDCQKNLLQEAFVWSSLEKGSLALEDAIDYLYDVRCDVVHRGIYYTVSFPSVDNGTSLLNPWKSDHIIIHITIDKLRKIILHGVVEACKKLIL